MVLAAKLDIETRGIERRHRCEKPQVGSNRDIASLRSGGKELALELEERGYDWARESAGEMVVSR